MEVSQYLKNTKMKMNKEMLFYNLFSLLVNEESCHDIIYRKHPSELHSPGLPESAGGKCKAQFQPSKESDEV